MTAEDVGITQKIRNIVTGQILEARRIALGMTVVGVCIVVKMEQSELSQIEEGHTRIYFDDLYKLLTLYGSSADEFGATIESIMSNKEKYQQYVSYVLHREV